MYLLYLDDTHLDDPVFAGSLAQRMHRASSLPPLAFVHGSGGSAERLFEAAGLFPAVQQGVLETRTAEEATLVERGLRTQNRRLVATLTDEGVPAVGIQGSDRGLLRRSATGALEARKTDWLRQLVSQGAVPVVSTLTQESASGTLRQAALPQVAVALAQALAAALVLLAASPAPLQPGPPRRLTDLAGVRLPDWAVVPAAFGAGVPLLLTDLDRFFLGEAPFTDRVTALLP